MIQLLSGLYGAFIFGCAAVTLFFFRYWRKSHDRLFAIMAIAFSLLTVERAVLAFIPPWYEGRHWIFLARLVAFILIILGIIDKNRPVRKSSGDAEKPPERPSRHRDAASLAAQPVVDDVDGRDATSGG